MEPGRWRQACFGRAVAWGMPADTGQHVPEPLNYVDGDWTSSSAPGQEVVDPATGETLATVGSSTVDDVNPGPTLVTEAIFGPVLGVLPVADVDPASTS